MITEPTQFTAEEIQHIWMSLEDFEANSSFFLEHGNPRDHCDLKALAKRFPQLKANLQKAARDHENEIAQANQALEEIKALEENVVSWEIGLKREKARLCLGFIDAGTDLMVFPEEAIEFLIELTAGYAVNSIITSRLPAEAWNAYFSEIEAHTGVDLWAPYRPYMGHSSEAFFQSRFNTLQSIITKLKDLYAKSCQHHQAHRDRGPHGPDRVLGTDDSQ